MEQLVGGQAGQLLADVECHPVEEGAVVGRVGVADAFVRGARRGVDGCGDLVVRVLAPVGRMGVRVVGARGEEEPGAVGAGDVEAAVGAGGDRAALGADPDLGLEAEPVVLERSAYGEPVAGGGGGEVGARRGVAQGEGHPPRPVRREPSADDPAGVGDEELPAVGGPALGVGDGRECGAQVQTAAVGGVGGGRGARHVEQQIPEDLVGAVAAARLSEFGGHRAGAEGALAVEAPADAGESVGPGSGPVPEVVALGRSGSAGPQGLLVEGEALGGERAMDARAEGAASDGQGFALPVGGRGKVVEYRVR